MSKVSKEDWNSQARAGERSAFSTVRQNFHTDSTGYGYEGDFGKLKEEEKRAYKENGDAHAKGDEWAEAFWMGRQSKLHSILGPGGDGILSRMFRKKKRW